MQDHYHIKFNRREPSREDIARRMDFDALLQQHEAGQQKHSQLRIRRLVYWSAAAAAGFLLLVSLWPWWTGQGGNLPADQYFAAQPFVNPPVPAWNTPAEVRRIDAYQGGVIEYPSGSRLVVPAMAFVDDRGAYIRGEVQIHYRELHDYIDFFVSGIPLQYDSSGVRVYLESVGMVEIYAEQNGRQVMLDPTKAIQVELVSTLRTKDFVTLPPYAVYQLDSANRTWHYRAANVLSWVDQGNDQANDPVAQQQRKWEVRFQQLEQARQAQLQSLEASLPLPPAPIKPEQATGSRPTLELDFLNGGDLALAPGSDLTPDELESLHRNAIWEVAPESPAFDERALQVTWEQVRLRRLTGGNYELTLLHPQSQQVLIVRPALTGDDYRRALAAYEAEVLTYEAAVAARLTQLQGRRAAIDANYQQQHEALTTEFGHFVAGLANEPELLDRLLQRRVVSRFAVNASGIWNCAHPFQPSLEQVPTRFVDDNGRAIANRTAYVVNQGQNTIYRYLAAPGATLEVDPTQPSTLIWLVTADGQLSVVPADQLEQLHNAGPSGVTFNLQSPSTAVHSLQDVRRVLSRH